MVLEYSKQDHVYSDGLKRGLESTNEEKSVVLMRLKEEEHKVFERRRRRRRCCGGKRTRRAKGKSSRGVFCVFIMMDDSVA